MSNYYEYREAKVLIARELEKLEGWTVYGHKPNESDPYTDYWSPEDWCGLAEKNGYIFVVNIGYEEKSREIYARVSETEIHNAKICEKISKLEQMTMARGASEQEETSAKAMIKKLQEKLQAEMNANTSRQIIGRYPAHQGNPSRCNWHIEKDGTIIEKGNGLLKYSALYSAMYYGNRNDDAETEAKIKKFTDWVKRVDVACGGCVGNAEENYRYEKQKVTEYKKENKVVEDANGKVQDGQMFVLKSNFNYGRTKGTVYKIVRNEYNGKEYFVAYRMNPKLTKMLTGNATRSNYWGSLEDKFFKWIEQGHIAWCHVVEVKTPYEVEKIVKVKTATEKPKTKVKHESKQGNANNADVNIDDLHYSLAEDTDTRNGNKIFLVRVIENLTRDEYVKVNKFIKECGGYYSKFKHAFLFTENPTKTMKVQFV